MATRSAYLDAAERDLWSRPSFRFIPDNRLPEPFGTPDREETGPRILFAGFPSHYSLAFLYALLHLDVRLQGIITSPGAHPAILGTNALSQVADHLQIPLLRLWRINDEHARLDMSRLRPDAVVMASFDQIVGARALAIPPHGWLNIHPSALPEYRGPEPIYWMITEGAAEAGITLHRAVPRFDAGPYLAQRLVAIDDDDTAGTLTRKLSAAGTAALGEALDALLADVPGTPIDPEQGSYRPSVGHRPLELARSALEADRMVRAGIPNMPAYITGDRGEPVYVLRAQRVPDCESGSGLRFDDGCLELLETSGACRCHHDEPDCPHLERGESPTPHAD